MRTINEAQLTILYQALGYMVGVGLGFGIISFFQRGFLIKFLMVRASMGRKILIRLKKVTHWDYAVGSFDEGDLIFGGKKNKKRINNIDPKYIWRSLNINWIDLDGKKWCILPPHKDEAVTGFDPEKQEALVTRALYKPPIEDMKDKVIIVLIVIALIASVIGVYLSYNTLNQLGGIKAAVDAIKSGIVVPT